MAPLNPILITVIGLVVTLTSLFIPHLEFFIYVGVAIFIYGVIRLYILGIRREKERKQRIQHYHSPPSMPSQTHRCPKCNTLARPHDNFCSRCGQMLRRR
jgi:uncharacterized paraquat-inducible protein A